MYCCDPSMLLVDCITRAYIHIYPAGTTNMRIQLVPGLSPVSPVTSFVPLVVVLAITGIKEAIEDYRRYLSDKKLNATPVKLVEDGKIVEKQWKDVCAY